MHLDESGRLVPGADPAGPSGPGRPAAWPSGRGDRSVPENGGGGKANVGAAPRALSPCGFGPT